MKKLLILPLLLFSIFSMARQIINIPEKHPQLSQEDYDGAVSVLEKTNKRNAITYGVYIQAALSYDRLLQPEATILDFIDKAFCEDPEATCRTLLYFDERRWVSFNHLSREALDELSNKCYCRDEE